MAFIFLHKFVSRDKIISEDCLKINKNAQIFIILNVIKLRYNINDILEKIELEIIFDAFKIEKNEKYYTNFIKFYKDKEMSDFRRLPFEIQMLIIKEYSLKKIQDYKIYLLMMKKLADFIEIKNDKELEIIDKIQIFYPIFFGAENISLDKFIKYDPDYSKLAYIFFDKFIDKDNIIREDFLTINKNSQIFIILNAIHLGYDINNLFEKINLEILFEIYNIEEKEKNYRNLFKYFKQREVEAFKLLPFGIQMLIIKEKEVSLEKKIIFFSSLDDRYRTRNSLKKIKEIPYKKNEDLCIDRPSHKEKLEIYISK